MSAPPYLLNKLAKAKRAWKKAKERVRAKPGSKNFKTYSDVSISPDFEYDFDTFLKHLGLPPTLDHSVDRIDNSKGYEPGNVRWATALEQTLNRGYTKLSYDIVSKAREQWEAGEKSIKQLADEHGCCYHNMYFALKGKTWNQSSK
jgi:hypothetical protein